MGVERQVLKGATTRVHEPAVDSNQGTRYEAMSGMCELGWHEIQDQPDRLAMSGTV